jgi:hypothetical protein
MKSRPWVPRRARIAGFSSKFRCRFYEPITFFFFIFALLAIDYLAAMADSNTSLRNCQFGDGLQHFDSTYPGHRDLGAIDGGRHNDRLSSYQCFDL